MARPLRAELAGHWYHVTSRGTERRRIFGDERDRRHWLELLEEAVGIYRLVLHGYVMMDNHYHGLIETREPNLGKAMHWLQTSYSVWYNRKHRRVGPLFQGRYKAVVVGPEEWGLALSRYVHLNPVRVRRLGLSKAERQAGRGGAAEEPVRARVEQRVKELRQYRWSSYRAYVGLEKPPKWLEVRSVLELGGWRGSLARKQKAYAQYVEESIREGLEEKPWEQLKGQVVLGDQELLQVVRQAMQVDPREQPAARGLEERPGVGEVIAAMEKIKGEKWEDFRDRHGDWGRDVVLYLARRACGLGLRELGEAAGQMDYAAVSAAIKRLERAREKDRPLAAAIRRLGRALHIEC